MSLLFSTSMTDLEHISFLKEQIVDTQLDTVFGALRKVDWGIEKEVLLLQTRWNKLKKQEQSGILSMSKIDIRQNKINAEMINLLSSLEKKLRLSEKNLEQLESSMVQQLDVNKEKQNESNVQGLTIEERLLSRSIYKNAAIWLGNNKERYAVNATKVVFRDNPNEFAEFFQAEIERLLESVRTTLILAWENLHAEPVANDTFKRSEYIKALSFIQERIKSQESDSSFQKLDELLTQLKERLV